MVSFLHIIHVTFFLQNHIQRLYTEITCIAHLNIKVEIYNKINIYAYHILTFLGSSNKDPKKISIVNV